MSGYEQALLTRAEVLEDAGELVRALDPGASTGYDAGGKEDRRPGGRYRSDGEFLEAVSDVERDVQERLQERVTAALDAAQAALDDARQTLAAAYAMTTQNPCDGCHPAKAAAIAAAEAAIAAAERRISLCEAAAEILDPLEQRLRQALGHLRQVPEELGGLRTGVRVHPERR
jgi:hypothetical protein